VNERNLKYEPNAVRQMKKTTAMKRRDLLSKIGKDAFFSKLVLAGSAPWLFPEVNVEKRLNE